MYTDNEVEDLVTMFQYRILCMLSDKEQDSYVERLIEQYNLIPISKHVKKRAYNLLNNSTKLNLLVKELEKPLSVLNMNELENRALLFYFALNNPRHFYLSNEEVKEIPGKILQLSDYAQRQMKLQELFREKDKSYNRNKSAKFFVGLLISLWNYMKNNCGIMFQGLNL